MLARKQAVEEERRQKSRSYTNRVAPNVSFAQMAAGPGSSQTLNRPKVAEKAPEADMDLKMLLLSMNSKIDQFQKQLNEQAARIDYIYSMFAESSAP